MPTSMSMSFLLRSSTHWAAPMGPICRVGLSNCPGGSTHPKMWRRGSWTSSDALGMRWPWVGLLGRRRSPMPWLRGRPSASWVRQCGATSGRRSQPPRTEGGRHVLGRRRTGSERRASKNERTAHAPRPLSHLCPCRLGRGAWSGRCRSSFADQDTSLGRWEPGTGRDPDFSTCC